MYVVPVESDDLGILVAESTVYSQLTLVKLAQVVCIQLKQIGEERLVVRRGGNEFNGGSWSFRVSCHDGIIGLSSELLTRDPD